MGDRTRRESARYEVLRLPAEIQGQWADRDPDGFYAAVKRDAVQLVETDAAAWRPHHPSWLKRLTARLRRR